MYKVIIGPDISGSIGAFTTFGGLAGVLVKNAIALAGVAALFIIVLGGISFILGAGSADSKKIEQGKQTITMAMIGFVVVVFAYWIVQIVGILTGLTLV